ncbi:MAG: phosphatase PAP2 family protein [Parcubacteria group bacterium]|nr:phosphatase PAP2 family protein [Parcubacteria group bacterium]
MDDKGLFFKKKLYLTAVFFIVCMSTYGFTNHYQFFSTVPLPACQLDDIIPYLPWTVLIYLSLYPFIILVLWSCEDTVILHRMLWGYYFVVVISTFIFFFFPTSFLWDHSSYQDFFTINIYNPFKKVDMDFNACPSQHVSLSLVGPFIYLLLQGMHKKGLFFLCWGIAISLTTLTVKQHYVVDLAGGSVLALLAAIFIRFYYPIHSNPLLLAAESKRG